MLKFIKSFFSKKQAEAPVEVPYKVETPEPSTVSLQASAAVVESIVPVAKKLAAKKTGKAKSSNARKPRAPKAK